jgi:hypothetical protein
LQERRQAALDKLMGIETARRGQLSEQFYESKGNDGKIRRTGPYYVWQRYLKGEKRSVRIAPSALDAIKADIKRGKDVQEIFDELWVVLEQAAMQNDSDSKKKSRRFRQH